MSDLELLRLYEPVARFTKGEMFFPSAVDVYVKCCSLWERDSRGEVRQLVAKGELNLQRLAGFDQVPIGHQLYLQYVEEPLEPIEYQRWRQRPGRVPFEASSRLARVSLVSRMAGSFFNLSLLLRGVVPGGTTATAEVQYRELCGGREQQVYFGRVVREGGWVVLHYLLFYPMNDWRSTFYGANDHEADWEQIMVYLSESDDGTCMPCWVAYASHDYSGDNLRRRWDDPLLVKEGTHPVVFVGAGSHASYFEPGEYIMGVEPTFLTPVKRALVRIRRFWIETLGQGAREDVTERLAALISVPSVDYARGDGTPVGSGHAQCWKPILISDDVPWVDQYRGLWGLDTRDPFGGERAPAGPKYNRDGSVRQSWHDPVGWAGLDKVTPPHQLETALVARQREIGQTLETLACQIEEERQALRRLALDIEAVRAAEHLGETHRQKIARLEQQERELQVLQARQVELASIRQESQSYLRRVRHGDWGDPRAHLRNVHRPEPPLPRQRHLVELWAATSGALALLALVLLLVFLPPNWWMWALVIGLFFAVVESTMRGKLTNLLLNIVIILAIITALILVWEWWRVLVILALIAIVIHTIRDNVRELLR
jgi:hypothetical protein